MYNLRRRGPTLQHAAVMTSESGRIKNFLHSSRTKGVRTPYRAGAVAPPSVDNQSLAADQLPQFALPQFDDGQWRSTQNIGMPSGRGDARKRASELAAAFQVATTHPA